MNNDNFNPFEQDKENENTNATFNVVTPENEVNSESQTINTNPDNFDDIPVESESVPNYDSQNINNFANPTSDNFSNANGSAYPNNANNNPYPNNATVNPVYQNTTSQYENPNNPPIYQSVNESSNYYINNEGYNAARNSKNKKKKKGSNALVICLVTLCALGIVGAGIWGAVEIYQGNNDSGDKNTTTSQNESESSSQSNYVFDGAIPDGGPLTKPQIYAKVKSSVVTILSSQNGGTGMGTGIVMKEDGSILTNAHVIVGGTSYKIITSDGKEYTDVKVQGYDTQSDLAVLKINSNDKFSAASFGKTSELVVGQSVVAIGNPFSLDLTTTYTDGIISGIRSKITLGDFTSNLIQTNAAVNPGNSGGPLIDEYGRVIGIVNMKIMSSSNGSSTEGLGFAIPMDVALPIAESLIKDGYIPKPMLGLTGYFVEPAMAQINSMPVGILVESVSSDSDLARQGIKKGDVITKINDVAFKSLDEFNKIKAKFKIGENVKLTVFTDNSFKEFNIKLVDSKESN
ncbi:MAG: trypsin-like peptidase domain-containing protein [Clostridia bacterium]